MQNRTRHGNWPQRVRWVSGYLSDLLQICTYCPGWIGIWSLRICFKSVKVTNSILGVWSSTFSLTLYYVGQKWAAYIKVNTEPCCVLCVLNLKLRWLSVHPELLCSTATTPPWGPFDPWPTHHPACHPALPCLWNWISDCSEILQLQLHSRPSAEDGIWENRCHL